MKYFTFDWWCGAQSAKRAQPEPLRQYQEHLERIRDRLTPDLLRIETDLSLHDGLLRELRFVVPARELQMKIDGDNGSEIRLFYGGVSGFESVAPSSDCLRGSGGYGDLGYWETDVLRDGFEHRYLFSTGIEMRIQFTEFRVETSDD